MRGLEGILDSLFPPRESERLVRNATFETLATCVAPTTVSHEHIEVIALLPYKDPLVTALIIEAKYHDNKKAHLLLGQVLGEFLNEFLLDQDEYAPEPYRLVPIPLSEARYEARGYNQAERIATATLRYLHLTGTPSTTMLRRVRDTKSQTHLPREERLENMLGAFAADPPTPLSSVILIDDVVTTGATLGAASEALSASGIPHIQAVALAH